MENTAQEKKSLLDKLLSYCGGEFVYINESEEEDYDPLPLDDREYVYLYEDSDKLLFNRKAQARLYGDVEHIYFEGDSLDEAIERFVAFYFGDDSQPRKHSFRITEPISPHSDEECAKVWSPLSSHFGVCNGVRNSVYCLDENGKRCWVGAHGDEFCAEDEDMSRLIDPESNEEGGFFCLPILPEQIPELFRPIPERWEEYFIGEERSVPSKYKDVSSYAFWVNEELLPFFEDAVQYRAWRKDDFLELLNWIAGFEPGTVELEDMDVEAMTEDELTYCDDAIEHNLWRYRLPSGMPGGDADIFISYLSIPHPQDGKDVFLTGLGFIPRR